MFFVIIVGVLMSNPSYSAQRKFLNVAQKKSTPNTGKVLAPYATAGVTEPTDTGNLAQTIDGQGALATQSLGHVHNTGMIAASFVDSGLYGVSIWPSQPFTLYTPTDDTTITIFPSERSYSALTSYVGPGGTDQAYTFSNTMVYTYLIYDKDTNTVAPLISTSPNMYGINTASIAGYTYFLPIGCGVVQSGGAFLPFQQFENNYFYISQQSLTLANVGVFTALDIRSLVPANAFAVNVMSPAAGGANSATFSVDGVNEYAAITNSGVPLTVPLLNTGISNQGKIYYTATSAMTLYVLGFILNL